MAWIYSVESIPDININTGHYEPHGMRIVKSFYSDTGELIVSVDTNASEAVLEGDSSLWIEYVDEARVAFKAQVDLLFDRVADGTLSLNSLGTILGGKLSAALGEAKTLKGSSN